MTTTMTTASDTATASGLTPIPFTFQALGVDEVGVQLDGVEQDWGDDFIVTLNGDGTGSITPITPWTGEVYIYSRPSFQQPTSFTRFGPMFPDQFNAPLDRLARTDIYLLDRINLIPVQQEFALGEVQAAANNVEQDAAQIAGYVSAVADYAEQIENIAVSLASIPSSGLSLTAANRTALALLPLDRQAIFDGSIWDAKLKTAYPGWALDATQQGRYVASSVDTNYVWVRNLKGPVNVKFFGATGDGVTDDTAAVQAALDFISSSTAVHRSLYFPAGTYLTTGLTLTAQGISLIGEGRGGKTSIIATSTKPALQTNGFWYSKVYGISFGTKNGLIGKAVVEQDGNLVFLTFTGSLSGATSATLSTPWAYSSGNYTVTFSDETQKLVTFTNGSTAATWSGGVTASASAAAVVPAATYGTQGITWEQCDFNGLGQNDGVRSTYGGFALCRQGIGYSQGSENLWLNCHWYNGSEACFLIAGTNALNNTIIGGNFQSYPKNGIKTLAGCPQILSVGFQAAGSNITAQLDNNGYDIHAATFSAGDVILVYGCRTESVNFYNAGTGPVADIRGLNQQAKVNNFWNASTPLTVGTYKTRTTASGLVNLYKITAITTGITGTVEPVWPDTGTVVDGGVTWTQTPVNAVVGANILDWNPNLNTVSYSNSVNGYRTHNRRYKFVAGPATYTPSDNDELIEVDATAGDVTINSPTQGRYAWGGRQITVIRTDVTSANKANFNGTYMLPGGSVTVNYANSAGAISQWQAIIGAYNPGKNAITVAQLPSVGQCPINTRFTVTDSNTATFNATVAGGGATRITVINDGVNWKVG